MILSPTLGELVRFVAVGGANTAVGLGTIFFMRFVVGTDDFVANFCGYAIGIFVSFVLNRKFTFADRGRIGPAIVRFGISVGISYVVNVAVLYFFLRILEAGSALSQIAGMVAYTGCFFILAKFFAFNRKRRS